MNPKDRIGSKKAATWVVPPAAIFELGKAHMDGARKYGAYNWRDEPVQCSIYLDAIQRHLALYAAGQEVAEDSGVHHLGHVMGCCSILLDAALHGKLEDDRRPSKEFIEHLSKMNEWSLENSKKPQLSKPESVQRLSGTQ